MPRLSRALLSGVAVFIAIPGVAIAQYSSVDASESVGLGDIVVTAQKSSENLQKTAAAVTAISGEALVNRGVVDLRDAQMVVPAARFQTEANNTQVFVRGVGSNLDFPNIDPTVAFNFNGVYMPREATSSAFFDISSMEVLPGPQGTLYGRGAMGGTVNVQFHRPEFNNSGTFIGEAGNYSLFHGSLAQNFAISDTLAVRAAVDYRRHDGYFTSGAESADDIAARVSLLYKPSSTFSAYIWAFGAWKNGTAANAVNHAPKGSLSDVHGGFLTSNPWDDVGASQVSVDLANFLVSIGSPLPFTVGLARGEKNQYKTHAIGGEFNLEIGEDFTLTYIPALLTRMSIPPSAESASSKARPTASMSATEPDAASTSVSYASSSAASSATPFSSTSNRTMAAPASASDITVARPIPAAAPVTRARLPAKLFIFFTFSGPPVRTKAPRSCAPERTPGSHRRSRPY